MRVETRWPYVDAMGQRADVAGQESDKGAGTVPETCVQWDDRMHEMFRGGVLGEARGSPERTL